MVERKPKIRVQDIPGQEEANRILNSNKFTRKGKLSKISALTGLCSKCKEKPAEKLVLFKLDGITKVERYCLTHFTYSAYETKKKKKKKVKK